jgi:hypothetical protein
MTGILQILFASYAAADTTITADFLVIAGGGGGGSADGNSNGGGGGAGGYRELNCSNFRCWHGIYGHSWCWWWNSRQMALTLYFIYNINGGGNGGTF